MSYIKISRAGLEEFALMYEHIKRILEKEENRRTVLSIHISRNTGEKEKVYIDVEFTTSDNDLGYQRLTFDDFLEIQERAIPKYL